VPKEEASVGDGAQMKVEVDFSRVSDRDMIRRSHLQIALEGRIYVSSKHVFLQSAVVDDGHEIETLVLCLRFDVLRKFLV